jgi:cyclopropane fatty-acyl-phospholipid synthase-like methyltransferase
MHLLGIGCGAGDVSVLVGAVIAPEGSVTGATLAAVSQDQLRCLWI